jgi:hypothetical protein
MYKIIVFRIWDKKCGGRRGRARLLVGFTTTCAISAYHH